MFLFVSFEEMCSGIFGGIVFFAILFLIIYMWYLYSIEAKKLATLKRVYEIIERS